MLAKELLMQVLPIALEMIPDTHHLTAQASYKIIVEMGVKREDYYVVFAAVDAYRAKQYVQDPDALRTTIKHNYSLVTDEEIDMILEVISTQ